MSDRPSWTLLVCQLLMVPHLPVLACLLYHTFGAAPKLSGTEKIPGSGIGHGKTAAARGSHHGNHRRQRPERLREARQKDPVAPDPETHLSMDDTSSSSSSLSTSLSLRPPSLVALMTAPSGRIKGGPCPQGWRLSPSGAHDGRKPM
jgi:hypothetical protein